MALDFAATYKILVLGDSNVGKTCIVHRFCDERYYDTYISTIGIDFKQKIINLDGVPVKLQIWDTAGQERFRTLTTAYYRGAMGALLLYDCTSLESFNNLSYWLQNIEENASPHVITVIAGNKCDSNDRVVDKASGDKIAEHYELPFFEISCKDNINIEATFMCLARKIREKREQKRRERETIFFCARHANVTQPVERTICSEFNECLTPQHSVYVLRFNERSVCLNYPLPEQVCQFGTIMYKPPQNSNLVKSMKEKFENIDLNSKCPDAKIGNRVTSPKIPKKAEGRNEKISNIENKNILARQLSDPLKRNIKRTPAFRLDKNVEKVPFQRNSACNRSSFEIKVKQFNGAVKNCDTNQVCNVQEVKKCSNSEIKPLLKSKSSHDFTYLRSKFNTPPIEKVSSTSKNIKKSNDIEQKIDLSILYTEPIPKSQRSKKNVLNNEDTTRFNTIYNSSTLKLTNKEPEDKNINKSCLTDTLKSALRKPLPTGPAPRKPPRTFQYCAEIDKAERNRKIESILVAKLQTPKKGDPKYMLNKLEAALRNNKLRSRKQQEIDAVTTSGEDSDDSLLFRSKSSRRVPELPRNGPPKQTFSDAFSALDCSFGISCANPVYERVKEGNSSFFVNTPEVENEKTEPIYDEPIIVPPKKQGDKKKVVNCSDNLYMGYNLLDPPPEDNTDLLKPKTDLQLRGCSSSC